jgi:serine/threonine protein kinase
MFKNGDIIDGQYTVTGICSETGGMGAIVFVESQIPMPFPIVLKYCREITEEHIKRFRRETRLLTRYAGNRKIVNIIASNPDYDPPYVVMRYYSDGDLTKMGATIRSSHEILENIILQMIEGLYELHSRGHYHRDIKPQNFLIDGTNIVVSDFGLSTEIGSETAFTRSSAYWGTPGYIPPEFLDGGFKYADASGDIFMLGKTIYNIATDCDPMYIVQGNLPAPLYHVIERCCSVNKRQRYQNLADFRQSVVAAFDVILGRGGGISIAKQLLNTIIDKIQREHQYDPNIIAAFVEQLGLLEGQEKARLCMEIPKELFSVFSQVPVQQYAKDFLTCYEEMVESQSYGWSYAETITSNMNTIFSSPDAEPSLKGVALDLAIRSAIYMNRFAAMDMCSKMICSVTEEPLGSIVATLINKHRSSFVDSIEPFNCPNQSIVCAIKANNASSQL